LWISSISLFSRAYRPAVGPKQSPIQRPPGTVSLG
jgi:hypothetical protein